MMPRKNAWVATVLYHVTSSVNRDSIAEHGLDWRRMRGPGIAGSAVPEARGVFLARDLHETDFFLGFPQRDGSRFDVWEVTFEGDVESDGEPRPDVPCRLVDGFLCWTEPIAPMRLRLAARDLGPDDRPPEHVDPPEAGL